MAKRFAQVKEEPAQRAGDTEQNASPPSLRGAPPDAGPDSLAAIDWAAPWLAPWCAIGHPLATSPRIDHRSAAALNAAPTLAGCTAAPVRFVPQADLPAGEAYEAFIFRTGQVPTREGLHDFFNGLMWLHFPQTKQKLNRLQAAQIAATGIQPQRGPARDALTLFDENAALFQGPDALWQALQAKDWHSVFVTLRPLWAHTRVLLFGHALMEKLVYPRKPITAHVYRAQVAINSIAELDAWLAQDVSAEKLAAKPFAHLPVLGVPQWWPANDDPDFYADASVFRAPRSAVAAHPVDAAAAPGPSAARSRP